MTTTTTTTVTTTTTTKKKSNSDKGIANDLANFIYYIVETISAAKAEDSESDEDEEDEEDEDKTLVLKLWNSRRQENKKSEDEITDADKEAALQLASSRWSQKKMHAGVAKTANGTAGEQYVCRALNLTWNKASVHGWDAKNDAGQTYEIKAGEFKNYATGASNSKTPYRFNINYRAPVRPSHIASDDDEAYLQHVRNHYLSIKGGHYWAGYNIHESYAPTQLAFIEHLSSDFVADLIVETMRKNKLKAHMNFGGAVCSKCHLVHRITFFSHLAATTTASERSQSKTWWSQVVRKSVPSTCKTEPRYTKDVYLTWHTDFVYPSGATKKVCAKFANIDPLSTTIDFSIATKKKVVVAKSEED